jgi:hypothetical protein
MSQSFNQFIITNFTVSVFVSVIVYKIFSIILDELVSPCVYMILDPQQELPKKSVTIGQYSINYGKSMRDLTVSTIILIVIYFLFNSK